MKTGNLIETLVESSHGVNYIMTISKSVILRLLCLVFYVIFLTFFPGLRPDFFIKIAQTGYFAELVIIGFAILLAIISTIYLSVPDLFGKKYMRFLPFISFALIIPALYISYYFEAESLTGRAELNGMDCAIEMAIYSMLPLISLIIVTRLSAPVYNFHSAFAVTAVSLNISYFILRITEQNDDITHIVNFHYLPFLVIFTVYLAISYKLCKWKF